MSPTLHTPMGACVAVGLLAAVPLLQYAGAAYIAIAATGMIYLSYLLGNIATLRARLAGWPRAKAPFSLGQWGTIVNILALLWGGAMLVNFGYPRVCCVLWTVCGGILLLGAVYYFGVQTKKPFVPVVAPADQ